MLEARDRLGGRAFTRQLENNIIFDVGCGWLHSADQNKFVGIAEQLGLDIDRGRPHWSRQTFNIGFPQKEREAYMREMDAFYTAPRPRPKTDQTVPRASCCCPAIAGTRCSTASRPTSTASSSIACRSTTWTPMRTPSSTGGSKRGYGALVAAYGAPCPVAFDTRVDLIDHSSARIRIETSRGTLTAGKVIVTVPTNLIANESVRFFPTLPERCEAARGLPLGLADKVMLALDNDGDALPKDGHLRGSTTKVGTGSYHLRPQGFSSIEGYFGGRFARELEDAGEGAFAAAAIDEIVALLGSDYRKKLRPLARVALGTRPVRDRLLLPRPARPRRRSRETCNARRRPHLLCRRGHFAELLLHLPRRAGERDQGGRGSDGTLI